MLFFFMLIINPITHQIQSYYQFVSILYKTKLNKLNYEFDKAKLNKLNYELICFVCSAFYVGNFFIYSLMKITLFSLHFCYMNLHFNTLSKFILNFIFNT